MLRNGFLIALLANTLVGISLVWDKVLLRRLATRSLANYVFWLGAMSIFGLALVPFGFHMPSARYALLGFFAGIVHLIANFFYYEALQSGEASHTLAIMGGLSPTATVLIAMALLKEPLGGHGAAGFVLMVAGGFVMFLAEPIAWRKILAPVLLAAGFFGLTNVLQKMVFDETGFVTGYVFFTLGTFAGSLLLLARSTWRRQILRKSKDAPPRSRFWYFVNRFISGVGSFLIFVAISRASPAVVDAISGIRYAIIFVGAWLVTRYKPGWLREEFTGWTLLGKTVGTALVVVGLVIVGLEGETADGGQSVVEAALPSRDQPLRHTIVLARHAEGEHGRLVEGIADFGGRAFFEQQFYDVLMAVPSGEVERRLAVGCLRFQRAAPVEERLCGGKAALRAASSKSSLISAATSANALANGTPRNRPQSFGP